VAFIRANLDPYPCHNICSRCPSYRRGRRAQPSDQRQDFGEQPTGHRDFGELERDVSAVRACRKLWRRPHDGLYQPQFHALLTAGRPKQTDSIRFCSHTVQAPAKPNPFRSHSMASNPRIVRRAVWKD
jgi:hypothetical protein